VDGKPIGQSLDGVGYLAFLTRLKEKVGPGKSVSIAAPASYWYLRAFPIADIASKIDYIVYMTYDLHGQWDYGNVYAFDSCPSGKCIRSHGKWRSESSSDFGMLTYVVHPRSSQLYRDAQRTLHQFVYPPPDLQAHRVGGYH
jgi:hypothetical protein